jgi:hypothetical protein
MDAFVVRTDDSVANEIFKKLKSGSARIGWSSGDDQNLATIIKMNNEGRWAALNGDQQDA